MCTQKNEQNLQWHIADIDHQNSMTVIVTI